MAFFIKDANSITASLIQSVSQSSIALTDFNVGSVVRTMLEAFAQELDEFYLMMFRGILEGIDSSVYNSFDFPALPAIAASGNVVITLNVTGTSPAVPMVPTSNITIPQGFRFSIPSTSTAVNSAPAGTVYAAISTVVWQAGQTSVTVPVACATAGSVGNTIINSVTGFVDTLSPITGGTYSVTNPVPFNNGQDQETTAARKIRFAQYLQSLSRGTLTALEYGASQAVVTDSNGNIIEQVKQVYALEPYQVDGSKPPAHVDLYIYNGVGDTSSTLVSNCQEIIDGYIDTNGNHIPGYKSAGIIATVLSAQEFPQNVQITTTWMPSYSLTQTTQSAIAGAVAGYFNSLKPGDPLIYNELVSLVMGTTGILNCQISNPPGDLYPANQGGVITLQNITIS